MEKQYYCPKCSGELERLSGCGTVGYFCDKCKCLISKSKILTLEEMQNAPSEDPKTTSSET